MGALLRFLLAGVEASPRSLAREKGLAFLEENAKDPSVTTLPSGLQYKVVESGSAAGQRPTNESRCLVNTTQLFVLPKGWPAVCG